MPAAQTPPEIITVTSSFNTLEHAIIFYYETKRFDWLVVWILFCGDGQTKPGVTLALYPFCFEERPTMRGS